MSVNGETGDFGNSELKRDQQDSNEKIISEKQKLRIELEKISAELNARKRELEIEAALEKVRASAMSMHISKDLRTVVKNLYEQLRILGFQWGVASITIMDSDTGDIDWWMEGFDAGYDLPERYHVPFFEHPGHLQQLEHWKRGTSYAEIEISGQDKNTYDAYYFFQTDFSQAPESSKQLMMQQESVRFSMAYMKYGALSWSPSPLSKEQAKILERFAKVFEQSYTRFLDLQKAEAQAREAQIEAALEKIRSRSLAMHHSDELREVIAVFFEKLIELDALLGTVGIVLYDQKSKDIFYWVGNSIQDPQLVSAPYDTSMMRGVNFFSESHKAIANQTELLNKTYTKQQKDRYFEHLFSNNDLTQIPEGAREILRKMESHLVCFFPNKHSSLFADSWDGKMYSEDGIGILRRAARVFEQAYVRFLDLQKAEAQAREAQIEAALERVRSASMAMHNSDELQKVIKVLTDQLTFIGFPYDTANFIVNESMPDWVMWISSPGSGDVPPKIHIDYFDHRLFKERNEAVEKGESFLTVCLDKNEKNLFLKTLFEKTLAKHTPEERKKWILAQPGMGLTTVLMKTISLSVINYQARLYSEKENEVIKRFATVFEQSYVRFLDLQKAEAQAREAQIEAALERVRSQTMAMHKSEDLLKVITVVSEQLQHLNFKFNTVSFAINSQSHDYTFWFAILGDPTPIYIHVPYIESPMFDRMKDVLADGIDFYSDTLTPEENRKWHEHVFEHAVIPSLTEETKAYILRSGYARSIAIKPSIMLIVSNYAGKHYSESENEIIKRFGTVFEQSYTRFLDLQKAEAQAREAQIEAALERVRARTMGMQKSVDLRQVVKVLYDQLKELGFQNGVAAINIMDTDSGDIDSWGEGFDDGYVLPEKYRVPYFDHKGHYEQLDHWKKGSDFAVIEISGPEKKAYDACYFFHTDFKKAPENTKKLMMQQEAVFFSMAYMKYGALSWAPSSLSEEQAKILQRFAKVFEQSYTRFIDLQKAEAQTREAQIEAALERVRARTMAMHSSSELIETSELLFDQLKHLGAETQGVAFAICDPKSTIVQKWTSIGVFSVPYTYEAGEQRMYEAWKNQTEIYEEIYEGERLRKYYALFMEIPEFKQGIQKFIDSGNPLPDWQKNHAIPFKYGYLLLITLKPFEETHIFTRFAKVFEQTYTRFLDLQRAEAQTKEAQIEASLERIRSKAMAMHSSQDLAATIGTFYRELQTYSFTPLCCGVGLLSKEDRQNELFTWNTTEEGQSLELVGKIMMEGHPVLENVYENWLTQTEYYPVLRGKEISDYYQVLRPQMAFPDYLHDEVHYGYFFFFPEGGVYAWTQKEMQEDELKIYRRFTSVLSLTYKRYKDLKEAEARALLAVRESSLARVRAEIASMRTAEDLQRITPLIWHELTALGVPFFRCGIFIVNEKEQKAQVYLSNPEGNSLAVLSLDFDSSETNRKAIEHWRSQKVYIEHWNREQFAAYTQSLIDQGQIQTASSYQGGEEPPESLTLHFLPFSQGMLYVGSAGPLTGFHLELAMALAEAFSVAYARYEDFSKLESAKKQVEKALVDLKQTQEQLVQQEKMASLGQLTAGIAHEIKNPLNFVNNFSEVSVELIDEIFGELEKLEPSDCKEEIIALLEDVKSNIAKVNEHGKRADGIVKSMLQHSRSSGNKTASKDFNPIVREFANLAYHGMRAGKSPINVELDLQLDQEVGEVKLISEDFSRVILNLCNNAFDAMRDKLQEESSSQSNYLPKLSISTKKNSDWEIQLTIGDNGKGIPEEIIDKILEPFFTTKKGTEGTGLGLSISYDIIKAHGGKLEVHSTVGVGTEFIIQIPTDF